MPRFTPDMRVRVIAPRRGSSRRPHLVGREGVVVRDSADGMLEVNLNETGWNFREEFVWFAPDELEPCASPARPDIRGLIEGSIIELVAPLVPDIATELADSEDEREEKFRERVVRLAKKAARKKQQPAPAPARPPPPPKPAKPVEKVLPPDIARFAMLDLGDDDEPEKEKP